MRRTSCLMWLLPVGSRLLAGLLPNCPPVPLAQAADVTHLTAPLHLPATAVPAPSPVPLPALYAIPRLLGSRGYLPERANIPVIYRPHPLPLAFSRLRVVAHVRRYAGQVGPYQATVQLAWRRPDSVAGIGHLGRPMRLLHLGTDRHRPYPGRTVLTLVQGEPARAAGTWRLTGWPGPLLTGTWVDARGHRYPLRLREDYTGAVPYDIERLVLQGGKSVAWADDPHDTRVPHHYQEYLHLLGKAGRRPALRRWQAPPLVMRRRQLLAAYERERTYAGIEVRLNDHHLLSYQASYLADPYGGRPQPGVKSFLVDLVSGRQLTLASQLRPGYNRPLRRLLTRHLLADPPGDRDVPWKWLAETRPGTEPLVELPLGVPESLTDEDLLLTDDGLEATFSSYTAFIYRYVPSVTTLVPYAELRPLVRPGTPLARMLRARGL